MDLDFLEIGTSNFETLLQTCKDTDIGMSVEPLKFYLDDLPDRPNVTKVNAAITHKNKSKSIYIFYIPPKTVDKEKLPQWFKGCNSIDKYHPLHIKHNVTHHVEIVQSPLMNVDEFMLKYNIRKIKFLKIDTEGHDSIILRGFFEFMKEKGVEYYPSRIQFETNEHTPKNIVDEIINLFRSIGYKLISSGYDTLLEY